MLCPLGPPGWQPYSLGQCLLGPWYHWQPHWPLNYFQAISPFSWKKTQGRSLGWEDPLEKGMATHSSILALKNTHGQRSLAGCSPWACKESDMTGRLHFLFFILFYFIFKLYIIVLVLPNIKMNLLSFLLFFPQDFLDNLISIPGFCWGGWLDSWVTCLLSSKFLISQTLVPVATLSA